MIKYIFLFGVTLTLFSGCISKEYIYLKNSTDDILYFNDENMGIRSTLIYPDSSQLLALVLLDHKRDKLGSEERKKLGYMGYGLTLALKGDTIYLPPNQYHSILDSLIIKGKDTQRPSDLVVTKRWFDQQKKSFNKELKQITAPSN